jgi:adenylate cyclase
MMLKSLASMKTSLISFNKFIPQSLIKKLLQKGTEVKLGGSKKDLTMFFSDIANFTSISETMTPEKLVEHLSLYFDELSHIITENNGTIDKYIGDSIMAFWGAPLHDKDQTYNACHTALKCQKRLSELNRQWELEGKPIFKTRIGVHRDDVLVGIIGSREKMNYTLIGDGVNAASRLEGLNKAYGSLILVSENIVSHVEEHFLFRPLDIIAVKGKKKPMHIFELVAQYKEDSTLLPTKEQKELCDAFTSAFKLYSLRRFEDALKAFEEIHGHFPHDAATEVFIKRCQEFIKTPPPPEWEGFIQATTK